MGMDFGVLLVRFSTCKLGVKGMHPWTSPKRRKIKDALLVLFVPPTYTELCRVQYNDEKSRRGGRTLTL
jgi:hypothetical protein